MGTRYILFNYIYYIYVKFIYILTIPLFIEKDLFRPNEDPTSNQEYFF